jgi:two-component system, cell cycle sensor histidine kinase and response regulator CckA
MAGRRTILVVNADDIVQSTVRSILHRMGYRVLLAFDTPPAAELFRRHATDLALLIIDVSLRTLSGPEFVRRLPTLIPRIPVMLMSALGDLEVGDALKRHFGVLQKPFSATVLIGSREGRGGRGLMQPSLF